MKGPSEKSFDGIYSNPLFVHTSAALIGCVVQLQVKNGSIYEGVFRTFSHKMDIALEMAHKLEGKKSNSVGNPANTMLCSVLSPDEIVDKLVFKVEDVVCLSALNTDPEFATRETFTDTAISKFNGQVQQRELEPWDGGELTVDGLGGLGTDGEESNGWDPNEMFRTNEEKYGVTSSFDSELPGYTIALTKRNTEEYKQQEAKASKIAQIIESGIFHRSRNALENGDEEDRFSAVVRPENRNAIETRKTDGNRQPEAMASKIAQENEIGYYPKSRNAHQNGFEKRFSSSSRVNGARYPPRKKNPQGMRPMRSSPSPSTHSGNRNSNHSFQHHPQSQPHRVSSPATSAPPSGYKTASSTSSASCVSTPSPRPTPSSTPTPRHPSATPQILPPTQPQQPLPVQLPPAPQPLTSSPSMGNSAANNQSLSSSQDMEDHKVNGVSETEKTERELEPKAPREIEQKLPRDLEPKPPRDLEPKPPRDLEPKPPREQEPKPPRLSNQQTNINRENVNLPPTNQPPLISGKITERRKDGEKKLLGQKARDDKTEDLKRFHAKFKLSEDKESKDYKEDLQKLEASNVSSAATASTPKQQANKEKEKSKEEEKNVEDSDAAVAANEAIEVSSLNPNAKEFVLNPNAKAFTPEPRVQLVQRAVPSNVAPPPPPMQPPPRLHTQSPVMVPQPHIMPGMGQPIFANMAPHYVVSATPVSVPLGAPFNPSSSISQGPRFRRAVPMTLQRHEMSQSVHVQAATGPPILAQPALSTPQFAIQYAPSPGMIHPQGPPQQAIGYAQMYSVMTPPRVLNPQAVGIVPTSSYGESPHVPGAHLYMHPGTQSVSHVPPGSTGQHSSSSTPQSQTPALHTAPSPVHQPPPPPPSGPHGSHGQPPTPTGGHPGNAPTPQPVIYHGHIPPQHPVHTNPQAGNQTHAYPASFPGTPQPIMLLPQQAVSGGHAPHPASFPSSLQNHLLHGQTPGNHAGTPTHVLPHPPMAMIPTSAAMVHSQSMQSGHFAPHTQGDLLLLLQRLQ